MGAGKSSVGKQLARQLGKRYLDSDREIEQRTGADIPLIFELEGEQGFRERESRVIAELTQESNIVLSTGGGAILREENREHLSSRGTVIYLRVSIEEILKRTAKDKKPGSVAVSQISNRGLNHKGEKPTHGCDQADLGQGEGKPLHKDRQEGIHKGCVEIPSKVDQKKGKDYPHIGVSGTARIGQGLGVSHSYP